MTAAPQVTRRAAGAGETTHANRRWWDGQADAYRPNTGSSWVTSGSSGGPKVSTKPTYGSWATSPDGGSWRSAAVPASARAGWLPRTPMWSAWTCRGSSCGTAGAWIAGPVVQADAQRLPFRHAAFDLACSAYGAMPFVADAAAVLGEVARVLRPGGRFVFATSHPFRWSFLDDPGEGGLVAVHSYFDRRAYVEQDDDGAATYVEHHRTIGDWVRCVVGAGLRVVDLVEPEWPVEHDRTWGGWSRLRGRLIPGTAIFVCVKP